MTTKENSKKNGELLCSFCGKKQSEVTHIISGATVAICDQCIALCNGVLQDYERETKREILLNNTIKTLPSPREIMSTLDEYIIGQEVAKKTLAVAVYNHYKKVFVASRAMDAPQKESLIVEGDAIPVLEKSNVLIMGPSGSGKTLMAKTLAQLLDVPFAITDATSLTEAGYVGEDVENILLALIQNADNNIARASFGIIYVDEIDKIARKGDGPSITRDVSGEGVQQALLKIVEGTVANIPPKGGRKHPNQEYLKLDTTNILFIFGGAFVGIEKIVEKRLGGTTVGFASGIMKSFESKKDELLEKVIPEDLVEFGLIPEFIGRIPVVTYTEELKKEDLMRVLTEPKNAIVKQYTYLFSLDDVQLVFTEDALLCVAEQAVERKVGARGLRHIIEKALMDIMFQLPLSTEKGTARCIITREVIEKKAEPIIDYTQS